MILLGTDKVKHSTEASENFKNFSVDLMAPVKVKELKANNFSLGSHQQPYSTTASSSYEYQKSELLEKRVHSPTQNIHFGNQNPKKISIVQSEYTEKHRDQSVDLKKIKETHTNCHFTLGSFPNDYKSSNTDYRSFSTTPTRKSQTNHNAVSIVLGNFKIHKKTEAQEKFDFKSQNFSKQNPIRTGNLVLGSHREVSIATSKDFYKGEQLLVRDSLHNIPARANNVVLGKDLSKWRSSYSGSFEEKELKPVEKAFGSKKTNFEMGFFEGKVKSVSQESYTQKVSERSKAFMQDKIQVYMGGYKTNFATGNSIYGFNNLS